MVSVAMQYLKDLEVHVATDEFSSWMMSNAGLKSSHRIEASSRRVSVMSPSRFRFDTCSLPLRQCACFGLPTTKSCFEGEAGNARDYFNKKKKNYGPQWVATFRMMLNQQCEQQHQHPGQ